MARITGGSSTLLVLVTLLLLLVARAASVSLRRQQQSEAAAGGFAYPTRSMNKARPLTAITPRAASEMLQHALLFELEGGIAGGLLVRCYVW